MFSRLLLPAALLLGLANLTIGNQVTNPTPNVSYTATKTTKQVFRTMENQIGQKFAAVQVDRAKLAIAVSALGKALERANAKGNNFENNLVNDQLSGVKRENLEGIANFVCLKLGLKDPRRCRQIKDTFQGVGLADESNVEMEEFSLDVYNEEFVSLYGIMLGVQNSEGDVDISYTFHHQEFRLSPTPISPRSTTPSTRTGSTRSSASTRSIRSTTPSTTTRSNKRGRSGLTMEEREAIKHYGKYEALRKMKQENVIKSILYV